MKIVIDTKNFTDEEVKIINQIIGKKFELSLSGKERSEMLENRLRSVINEKKPDTTDYDFCSGKSYFFGDKKVELKQFDALGSSPKLQQVKPALYDTILVVAEYTSKSEWWVIKSDKISTRSGKENKEENKLTLQRQHKDSEFEGQVSFAEPFKKSATKIYETNNIDYTKETLNLSDKDILNILTLTKNH